VKTFLQLSIVGAVLAYIFLLTTLHYYQLEPGFLKRIDHVMVINAAMWFTAAVTVWTGIDYVVKYFSMIKSVLK